MNKQKTISIGKQIQYYRTREKLTLDEVGNISGISTHTISDIENDKSVPKFETVYKLCTVLNLKYDEAIVLLFYSLITQIESRKTQS